jgi:glycosyltransferase involved in cell wall biosynthesis
MRVAVDAHAVAQPTAGDAGNARWIESLIHALVATAGPGDDVVAMIAHDQARERIDPSVPLVEVTDRNVPRLLRGAPHVMERARADVGVFNYVVPFRGKTPSAVVVHDAAFVTNPGWFSRRDRAMLGTLVPRAIRSADIVIGVSHAEAAEITAIFGIDPAKVHVVRTYPAPVFTPDPTGAAADRVFSRFGLRRYVLAVGDIHPRKNIGSLARAMALCPTDPTQAFARYEAVRKERTARVVEGSAANTKRFHNPALAHAQGAAEYVDREWNEARVKERYEWLFKYDIDAVAL